MLHVSCCTFVLLLQRGGTSDIERVEASLFELEGGGCFLASPKAQLRRELAVLDRARAQLEECDSVAKGLSPEFRATRLWRGIKKRASLEIFCLFSCV